MKKPTIRTVVYYLGAVLVLAAIGALVWRYADDRLQYRRIVAMSETVERLYERRATTAEVSAALGEPDHVLESPEQSSWFYSGGTFRNHRQPTVVMDFDQKTSRLTDISYIHHN